MASPDAATRKEVPSRWANRWVRQMCDRVAVVKQGKLVALADTETLFDALSTDYTKELVSLMPKLTTI